MQLRIIKSESDYHKSLAYLNELMDKNPEPGSSESDELEVLAVLIEQFEDEAYPIDFPGPIVAIQFRMDQLEMKNRDLVPFIGSVSRVSEVLNHKRSLSLSMIRRLHSELGIPASVLLQEPDKSIPEKVGIDWLKFPIKAMWDNGYFPTFSSSPKDLKEYAEDLVRGFLEDIDEPALAAIRYKRAISNGAHKRSQRMMNQFALWAWSARVVEKAKQTDLSKKYIQGTVTKDFMSKLVKLSWSDKGPQLAQEYLNQHGIYLVIEKHLPKTYLDGASFLLSSGRPVVALTLRYNRIDNFWFVLMHELSHIALHLDGAQGIFFDDLDSSSEVLEEAEADSLAAEVLLPDEILKSSDAFHMMDAKSVNQLATSLEIHPAIVVGRLQKETNNYRLLNRAIGRGQGEVRKQFGYIE
ncbi:MAG: ImmA/IrrE family metallo-endopeptidase [Candidatus Thiodiazotropha sp. (ex Lucinoma kastoroae)]|nr:ImmA/IrrE family metallo-endopeptidase [Candidatus Thiodiazotropha sp. (ex Lucinoma kastoroae)]